MTERIRWGIMGNANIARVCVIPAICKSRNGIAAALASRNPAAAEPVVSKNGIGRLYDSYEALLEDPRIDAVYLPLPNHLHHPWTLKAVAAGKAVLCEKPLSCNARQAEEMADAAEKEGVVLMEAFMYRFHPRSRRLRELVAQQDIGPLKLAQVGFCYRMAEDELARGENFRLRPETGGGALLDVGCYGVSLVRWFFGTEPAAVQAQALYHHTGVDLHLTAELNFGDGLAVVACSFLTALQQSYGLFGVRGALELPHDAFIPWEKEALFFRRGPDEENGHRHVVPGADEYQLMVEHFADVVLGAVRPEFTAADSVANMRALDAVAQAARSGRAVRPAG